MAIEGRSDAAAGGRLRLGMVGGGKGAFIGAVHRLAARMDDQYVFVAGALSSEPARSRASGRELGLARDRIYTDYWLAYPLAFEGKIELGRWHTGWSAGRPPGRSRVRLRRRCRWGRRTGGRAGGR